MDLLHVPFSLSRTIFCDDRGHFENIPLNFPELGFEGKRAYICSNFKKGFVRGFHYHKNEAKVFICLQGAVKFVLFKGCSSIKDTRKVKPTISVCSSRTHKALYVPPDCANGWQSLTEDTILLGISNKTVEESKEDDIRFSPGDVEFSDLWRTEWR